ncbi:MAG TPA: carboxypeptidase regulatory-like domain-containing protein [Bryobacteraceae bacterium]|nr:carboxypeptidase regulatory-like domain-containing protein [Bryobacteraceae bacterium]
MRTGRFCILALLGFAAFISVAISSYGQSDYGSIVGFVKDPSGSVVPKAKVTVKNEATGVENQTNANESGYYVVPNIPPGIYTLTVESAGFKKFESAHNKLDPNSTLSADAILAVGTATETVEVVASATPLQTESAAVQKLVTRSQIDALELNGRNPIFMASLQPGIRSASTLGDFSFNLTNGGYYINGARLEDTLITFDGAPATRTRADDSSIGVADVDSTQEIQILTADYAAEYGRAAGGQIRIITKSGGKDFHGSMFEYFRNSALNANTWTRNQGVTTNFASPFRYNQFGFNIGGPVYIPGKFNRNRDKWFFFVGEEWVRYRYTDTQTQTVPTALMRQGNFSELLGPNIFYNKPEVIYDPSTCPSVGASTCSPFPNNTIPASRLSHNGLAIMSAYPGPTSGYLSGNQNWIAQAAHPINQRKDTLSSDFVPSDKDRIQFRRQNYAYDETIPFDQGSGLTPRHIIRPNQTESVSWTRTISPTLVNEARATVSLDDAYSLVLTNAAGFDRSQFGIDYPYLIPGGKDLPGKIPTVTLTGNFYSLAGGPYPSHSTGPIYTAADSLTKVWGNHTVKVGFYFEKSGENDNDQINVSTVPGGSSNQNGTFQFSDARTGLGATAGVSVANLALGLADSYTEIGPRAYTIYRGYLYEWFAQDSWKVTPKLHLDYGVRQTITVPWSALWGNQIFFDPTLYNPANAVQVDPKTGNAITGSGDSYDGMVIPGNGWPSDAVGHGVTAAATNQYNSLFHGLPSYYVNINAQFQPRLGVAYQVTDKTVIRTGIGRYLTRVGGGGGGGGNIFPGANSPFQPFVTVTNVSVDNPGASLSGAEQAPLTVTTLPRNLKPPESWNWNFTVQRELLWKSVLEVAYVGRRGLHEVQSSDINQPVAGALLANPGANVNSLRPYQGFASIQMETSDANSMYNALQVAWNRRFASGFGFGFSYTLSKSMDGSSTYRQLAPDTYNTSNLWGPSEFDTRHAVVINYVYALPFFKDQTTARGKLLGGWQISGVNQFQTGTPCGVGSANDYAGVGEVGSFGCGNVGQFWTINGTPRILGQFANSASSPNQYFAVVNSNGSPVFTPPAAGTFNLQPGVRDSIHGPGFQDWNLGLFKKFAVNERSGFEFRAEAFDVINHPNWSAPNFNPTSAAFGKVTGKTNLSRNIQLSLRFYF